MENGITVEENAVTVEVPTRFNSSGFFDVDYIIRNLTVAESYRIVVIAFNIRGPGLTYTSLMINIPARRK